jgi:hypothetical protein
MATCGVTAFELEPPSCMSLSCTIIYLLTGYPLLRARYIFTVSVDAGALAWVRVMSFNQILSFLFSYLGR